MFSYKLVLSLSLIIIFGYFEIKAKRVSYLQRNNVDLIKNDFPSGHNDLFDYVKSLEKITKFALNYNQFIDINFCFGIFIVNVNLRPFINHPIFTASFRERLWNILQINDKLIENFIKTESYKNDDLTRHNQLIWTHMSNETTWTRRLKKFNHDLLIDGKMAKVLDEKQSQDPGFKILYPDWDEYLNSVNNVDENIPDPQSSDDCLVILSENEENPTNQYRRCHFSEKCNEIILNGMNFGYALTHRFLYLVLARISLGCYIFSPERDLELRNELCEMMFEESKYIAFNGFKLIDLLLEEVSLCSLDGHAQFLRHSWLSELLTQQSRHGCFNQLEKENLNEASILNGECNMHVTSVAAATLASAVRFILEKQVWKLSQQGKASMNVIDNFIIGNYVLGVLNPDVDEIILYFDFQLDNFYE